MADSISDVITTDRPIWVTTSLPEGTLVLEEMSGQESLGSVFGYELSLSSLDPDIGLADLLGQPMTVHVALTEGERQFNGIVTHAQHGGTNGGHTRYRITLRPWLSLLSYTSNCRIFQGKSVVDIIKEVFRDNDFSDFEDALSGTYAPVEYCAQYRESDFNFVSRLMEHEGIYYYFKHEDERHTLVLADGYGAHEAVPGYEKIPYKQPDQPYDEDHLDAWIVAQQLRPGTFAATDFDFTRPRANLLTQLNAPLDNAKADYALFEYPGQFLSTDAGQERVKMRLQEAQVSYDIVDTAGDVRALASGALFTLIDFPRDDQNKEYLIISAHYHLHAGTFVSGGGGGSDEFRGSYTVIASQTQFRPALHAPKPRVEGPQTAIVVGQAGEEIWTDQYGRVKVQFHWDREGKNDENSSCWVRVAQVWAGAKWGAMHVPRIGQEVIVDFLEGDPDRPIITGRVYNGDNMPPYDLPANGTQSGIKSRSSKGGAPSNFNEIRFEDKKGSEELHIQAEKDETKLVKNNQSASIGADRSLSVGGNETVSIGKNRSETVGVDESVTVGSNQTIKVGANQTFSVGANRTKTVSANETVSIGANSSETIGATQTVSIGTVYSVTVGAAMSEKVGAAKAVDVGAALTVNVGAISSESIGGNKSVSAGGSLSESAGGDVSVSAGGGMTLSAGADLGASAGGSFSASAGKDGSIEAADQLTLTCGDATIVLKKNGDISINGKNIQVTASADLGLKGSKIAEN